MNIFVFALVLLMAMPGLLVARRFVFGADRTMRAKQWNWGHQAFLLCSTLVLALVFLTACGSGK